MPDVKSETEKKPRQPFVYERKTAADLETLARDVIGGRVFGTWNLNDTRDTAMVFMVVNFLDTQTLNEMEAQNVSHIYEYLSEASPRGVNGMPSFFSAHFLDRQDSDALLARIKELQAIGDRQKQAEQQS